MYIFVPLLINDYLGSLWVSDICINLPPSTKGIETQGQFLSEVTADLNPVFLLNFLPNQG